MTRWIMLFPEPDAASGSSSANPLSGSGTAGSDPRLAGRLTSSDADF